MPRTKLRKSFNWLGHSGARGDLRGQKTIILGLNCKESAHNWATKQQREAWEVKVQLF